MNTDHTAVRAEMERLALDALPTHLRAAGRVDRLLRLFHDDRRLRRRVSLADPRWDGYQSDIGIAWDAVDETPADKPEAVPQPIAELVRLALVRATLTAADEIPAGLLVAAVTTGHWSVERALSTIARGSSPGGQAEAYYGLLAAAQFDEPTCKAIRERLIELATRPVDDLPAHSLLRGIHLLDAEGRTAIAARIEDTARIVGWRMPRAFTPPPGMEPEYIEAAETAGLLCDVPEIRRPRLVARVADALLDDLTQLVRDEAEHPEEQRPPQDTPEPLVDQLRRDMASSLIAPDQRLGRTSQALAKLAPLLTDHPGRGQVLKRLSALLADIDDAVTRSLLASTYGLKHPRDAANSAPSPAPSGASIRAAGRHGLLRRFYRRLAVGTPDPRIPTHPASSDEADAVGDHVRSETLHTLMLRWFDQAWLSGSDSATRDRHHRERQEGQPAADRAMESEDDGSRQAFAAFAQRAGAPAVVACLLSAQQLSDEAVRALVEAVYLPNELPGQMALLELLTEHPDLFDATAAVRKVKGLLLRCALLHERVHPSAAWDGVPAEQLRDADFQPTLDLALTLPAEQRRSAYWYTTMGRGIPQDIRTIPRLDALATVLPHLTATQVRQAFENILAIDDSEVRRIGLRLLGPHLCAEQAAQAVASLGAASDAREITWLLGEFADMLPPGSEARHQVEEWTRTAMFRMDTGADLAEAILLGLRRAGRPFDTASLDGGEMSHIHRMNANNRLDLLLVLLGGTEGPIPAEVAAEIIDLPVVNDDATYSWRAFALMAVGTRFTDDWVPAAWYATQELPRRLSVGDAEIWGWDWRFEYPHAAAVEVLASRLRGPLARQAFEAAKDMPWEPRESIFQLLAEHGDDSLARDLFDHASALYRSYQDLSDDEQPPVPLEGTVITQPIPEFKVLREVKLSELIAVVGPKLDDDRMAEAVRLACDFSNSGPRSWLPARLLPLLPPERREPLLASATVSAVEFIAVDTSRLDILVDLLPYVRESTSSRAAPATEFVAHRFPRHTGGFLLDPDELAALSPEELHQYRSLLGIGDRDEIETGLTRGDDDERRRFLVRIILRPLFSVNLGRILAQLLMKAPVLARTHALEAMAQMLEPENHRAIVDHTLVQLLREPMPSAERLEGLMEILPLLEQDRQDGHLEHIALLDGPELLLDETVGRRVFELCLDDLRAPVGSDGRYSRTRHNVFSNQMADTVRDKQLRDVVRVVRGDRVHFLAALAPKLTPEAKRRLVERVLELPEIERADAITELLPLLTGDLRDELLGAVRTLKVPFARFWALFGSQDHLDNSADPSWAAFAWHTATGFRDPMAAGASLCLLAGYADAETLREWHKWAIDRLGQLDDKDAMRMVAAIAATLRGNRDTSEELIGAVCSRSGADIVCEGLLVLARHRIDLDGLAGRHGTAIRAALSKRLRRLAGRGRSDMLRTLATEAPVIGAMCTPDELSTMARSVHEVCFIWAWP
ncbi:hypothetical protein ACGFYQ_34750 [Streptomyces sp. NPDC048258]|uniref:hypothetical protein n=1 Tax=Streptomyces sp. NPDC048258 TaxID=3365527 RepID=UPI0037220E89